MYMEMVLGKFLDIFPAFEFGRIWTYLKHNTPTHPTGDNDGSASIAWVAQATPDHILPDITGIVCVTPNGKAVYWPLNADGQARDLTEARYIANPKIMDLATGGWLARNALGQLGAPIDGEDQLAVIVTLFGESECDAVLPKSVLG